MRVQSVNLNLIPTGVMPIVHLSQYDRDADGALLFNIFNGPAPFNLTGCTATINGTKPDGNVYTYPCTVHSNFLTSAVYDQMTTVQGTHEAEIRISDGDSVVGTLNLQMAIEKAGVSEIDVSHTDVPTLLENIQASVDEAEYWAEQAASAVTGVSSFNGRHGSVLPIAGDYDSEKIPLTSALHIGGETQNNVQEALEAIVNDGGAGHTILNGLGQEMPQRKNLRFAGANVSDDAENDTTNVIISGGGSGGSTITVTTTETSLYGETVTISDGTTTDTEQFSAGGVATFTGITMTGTLTITSTDGTEAATDTLNVPYYGNYTKAIAFVTFNATLNISTTSSALYGKTITITKGGATVGTTAFSARGSATYTVHETGTYTCECEGYSGSATVSAETTYNVSINSVNVTLNVTASAADGTTLTATNGTDTETATISNGKAEFNLSAGDWEVAGIPITVVAGQTYEEDVYVFAVHYSETDSNPDSTDYPTGYDNYGWTPFAMNLSTGVPDYGSWNPSGTNADKLAWFYPKSCMLKYDGTVDYYLDEDDESKKADGVTASDYNNTSYGGNVMMEWGQDGKRLYWKITADTNNDGWTFVVANAEVLGLKPWNHYDVNGDENEHWYTPKYFGSSDGTRMRSISGQSNYVNNTAASEISLAEANNQTNDKIWTAETFCDYMFIGLLCALISKSLNSQAKFGAGRSASENASAIGQGTMNGKGQFYGKSNGTDGVKIFGMENFFGNLWRRVRGLININGSYRIKMTYDQTDGSTTDGYNLDGTGYINAGSIGTTAAWVYPKHDTVRDNCILAQTNGGSETTYYCDATYLAASGTFYAFLGGAWNSAGNDGVFCVHLNSAASNTGVSIGAALSCKPLAD